MSTATTFDKLRVARTKARKLTKQTRLGLLVWAACNFADRPKLYQYYLHYAKVLTRPRTVLRRQRVSARQASSMPRPAEGERIPAEDGYLMFDARALPGFDRTRAACEKVLAETEALAPGANLRRENFKKDYFVNFLRPHHLIENPDIMRLALSEAMLSKVIDYFGYIPRMCSVGLYVSYPKQREENAGSQIVHWDGNDPKNLKCFINLTDVGPDDGPFTLISARASNEIARRKTGSRWKLPQLTPEEERALGLPLVGPAGSGAFVDTARCLHWGSRVKDKTRVVLKYQWQPFMDTGGKLKQDLRRDVRLMHHPDVLEHFRQGEITQELLRIV